jgi:hypothetical protein
MAFSEPALHRALPGWSRESRAVGPRTGAIPAPARPVRRAITVTVPAVVPDPP